MAIKASLPIFLLLSSLFLASFAVAFEEEHDQDLNPGHQLSPREEYQQCQSRCQEQYRGGQQQQLCEQRCQQRMRQRERSEEGGHGGEGGGGGSREREIRQEFERCRQDCESQERGQQQQRQQCERRCQQEYDERRREEQQREERERRRHQGRESENDEMSGGEGDKGQSKERELRQEFERCKQDCQSGERGQQQQRQQCERRCQQQYDERRREEQQREERERHRGQGRESEDEDENTSEEKFARCRQDCERREIGGQQEQLCKRRCRQQYEEEVKSERRTTHDDPEEKLRRCQIRCQEQQHVQERRRECEQECQKKYREEEHRGGRRRDSDDDIDDEENYNPPREGEWEEREREISPRSQEENPYHIRSQRLQSRYRTDEGHLKVLEKLSSRSELLKGLKNNRIVVLEANPNTFVVPHHCDADSVLVVTRGRGTISIVRQNNKESYNIECADVITVPAGSTVYLVNDDNNERLQITKLVTSVNIPGQFEEYFPAGGDNPQSYFKAFSTNILKRTLSATEDQIERLIGQQSQGRRQLQRPGFIKRASQEQLRALTQHASSPRRRGRESTGPISLRNQSPLYSNNYGKFYEASPEDNKQLHDMDVHVSWTDLEQGSIFVPHYNSRTTVLCMVVEGEGEVEMACPHLSRQRRQREWGQEEEEEEEMQTSTGSRYQKMTARLSQGDVFIIPAGHPISVVASGNRNLKMVGFGVNAKNNERYFLAGKDNMIKQLEREAKELAFNMPGREVEQIFNQPRLSFFVPQERSQEEEGHRRSHPLNSILNLAGFA